MPVIGYLSFGSPSPFVHFTAAFRKGLEEGGYVDGKNVVIEYRWAENQTNKLNPLASELVGQRVAVIVATGGSQAAVAAPDSRYRGAARPRGYARPPALLGRIERTRAGTRAIPVPSGPRRWCARPSTPPSAWRRARRGHHGPGRPGSADPCASGRSGMVLHIRVMGPLPVMVSLVPLAE
jgi:hypothetical protein